MKKTFLKSSGGVIIEKLSEIENDYYSGDISEEETVEDLNGLLSLNTSNEEILNFKNTLPLIKDSKDSFDIGISKLDEENYLEALNLEPITNYICTLEMLKQVKSYNGKNKKLETACSYYNIENKNAHRADSDTLATAKLFLTIKDKIDEDEYIVRIPNQEISTFFKKTFLTILFGELQTVKDVKYALFNKDILDMLQLQ